MLLINGQKIGNGMTKTVNLNPKTLVVAQQTEAKETIKKRVECILRGDFHKYYDFLMAGNVYNVESITIQSN